MEKPARSGGKTPLLLMIYPASIFFISTFYIIYYEEPYLSIILYIMLSAYIMFPIIE